VRIKDAESVWILIVSNKTSKPNPLKFWKNSTKLEQLNNSKPTKDMTLNLEEKFLNISIFLTLNKPLINHILSLVMIWILVPLGLSKIWWMDQLQTLLNLLTLRMTILCNPIRWNKKREKLWKPKMFLIMTHLTLKDLTPMLHLKLICMPLLLIVLESWLPNLLVFHQPEVLNSTILPLNLVWTLVSLLMEKPPNHLFLTLLQEMDPKVLNNKKLILKE